MQCLAGKEGVRTPTPAAAWPSLPVCDVKEGQGRQCQAGWEMFNSLQLRLPLNEHLSKTNIGTAADAFFVQNVELCHGSHASFACVGMAATV